MKDNSSRISSLLPTPNPAHLARLQRQWQSGIIDCQEYVDGLFGECLMMEDIGIVDLIERQQVNIQQEFVKLLFKLHTSDDSSRVTLGFLPNRIDHDTKLQLEEVIRARCGHLASLLDSRFNLH